MAWKITSDRPVYIQVYEEIEIRIINGIYPLGSRLPSVRELAQEAVVNPNTMQKSIAELERSGFVHANRTAGRFVTEDKELIKSRQKELVKNETQSYLKKLSRLGVGVSEAIEILKGEWQN